MTPSECKSLIDCRLLGTCPPAGLAYKYSGDDGGRYALAPIIGDLDVDEGTFSAVVPFADGNRRDGVGDLLEIQGINTSRHRLNPVVLFDHGKHVQLPVAMAEDPDTGAYTVELDPQAKTGKCRAFFYKGGKGLGVRPAKDYDHALFAEQVFDLLAKRYLRGGSLGYQIIHAKSLPPTALTMTEEATNLHLLSVLMLEASVVVMPANADTVGKALALPRCCGKPLSGMLVKSLTPYAQAKKASANGADVKGYGRNTHRPAGEPEAARGSNMKHDPEMSREADLIAVAEEAKKKGSEGPDGTPDYGILFQNVKDGKVWYVTADSHSREFTRWLFPALEKIVGEGNVTMEAEAFPPRNDSDWKQLWPKPDKVKGLEMSKRHKQLMAKYGKKGVNVKFRNKLVRGFAEVKISFDTSGLGLDDLNKFAQEMHAAGFGKPGSARVAADNPLRLASPLKSCVYSFSVEPSAQESGGGVSSAIRQAEELASKHKVRMTGSNKFGVVKGEKSMPKQAKKEIKRRVKAAPQGMPPDDELKFEDVDAETADADMGGADTGAPEGDPIDVDGDGTADGVDVDGDGTMDEPYGAQVVRRLHQDAMLLLDDYDQMMGPLENESVKAHLQKKLEALTKDAEEVEALFTQAYAEAGLKGLDGAELGDEEGLDEEELGDEEVDPNDDGENPPNTMDDQAIPADSEEEEDEPDPEEVVESMATKSLNLKRVKQIRRKYMAKKKGCACPTKELMDEDDLDTGTETVDDEDSLSPLDDAQKNHVLSAADFLDEATDATDFGEDHRMRAYHHGQTLGSLLPKSGEKGHGGPPKKPKKEKTPRPQGNERNLSSDRDEYARQIEEMDLEDEGIEDEYNDLPDNGKSYEGPKIKPGAGGGRRPAPADHRHQMPGEKPAGGPRSGQSREPKVPRDGRHLAMTDYREGSDEKGHGRNTHRPRGRVHADRGSHYKPGGEYAEDPAVDSGDDIIDMGAIDGEYHEEDGAEGKSHAWHKTVGEASGFLGELSKAKDFGMKHQKMCKTHADALRGVCSSDQDEDAPTGGDVGEKALNETLINLEKRIKALKAAI